MTPEGIEKEDSMLDPVVPSTSEDNIDTLVSEQTELVVNDTTNINAPSDNAIKEGDSVSQSSSFEVEWQIKSQELLEVDAKLHTLMLSVSHLQEAADQLQSDFQSKLKYDAHKEKIIDTLHAELQTYKNGLIEKLIRPIMMDIIEVVDDTRKLLRDITIKGEGDNPITLKKIVESLPLDLEDLLYKHGIEVIISDQATFNPALQKAVKIIATDQLELDKTICERLKNGYQLDGKLIRPEMVTVYQCPKKDS